MSVLRRADRLFLPVLAVVCFAWLVAVGPSGERQRSASAPSQKPQGRHGGRATGVILPSELRGLVDSALVGLYDDRDSLVYVGTPAQMEAYLLSIRDSLDAVVPQDRGVLPSGP